MKVRARNVILIVSMLVAGVSACHVGILLYFEFQKKTLQTRVQRQLQRVRQLEQKLENLQKTLRAPQSPRRSELNTNRKRPAVNRPVKSPRQDFS